MKVPAPPPDQGTALERLSRRTDLLEILRSTSVGIASEPYIPWDKFRHKVPPGDLSVEEWWVAVRMARRTIARRLDLLVDKVGEPFTYALSDAVLEAVEQISRRASGQITISEQVTDSSTRDRYVVSSLIEEAITSSQLEGAATSRRVAKAMIRSGRQPNDRSERMILNNYWAMRHIVELRDTELTPDLVRELHRIVTEGTLDNPEAAGVIQNDEADRVSVWGDGDQLLHRPPHVDELSERLERLCKFANGQDVSPYMPPALRAIAVHFMVGYDHYFEDGNGRTARALFYWTMLREGYWLAEFLTISRVLKKAPAQYARSFLLTEDDAGDLTHFFLYHLDVINRSITELHDYLARKAEELRDIQSRISTVGGEFNHRQLNLLEHAVRNPDAIYSAHSHSLSHHTSGETARQDLIDLESRGLLARSKSGRRHVWKPASDLPGRLQR